MKDFNNNLAYVTGVAIGDGNLSNPNGRAVRLRVSCDNKYPKLIERIKKAIQQLLPTNKISIVNHYSRGGTWCDISCYSNKWEDFLNWRAKSGSKFTQNVSVPVWIRVRRKYTIKTKTKTRYNIRVSKDVASFIKAIKLKRTRAKKMIWKYGQLLRATKKATTRW